jgi:hypothetical protein
MYFPEIISASLLVPQPLLMKTISVGVTLGAEIEPETVTLSGLNTSGVAKNAKEANRAIIIVVDKATTIHLVDSLSAGILEVFAMFSSFLFQVN